MLRGIYLLPSLFTAGNLAAGMMSVIYAMNGQYTAAGWAIIVAMAMDILDGRVARWTNTTSKFGVEFDSLSDLVSFGVAPAVLMYRMVLHAMHVRGVVITLFFVVAGALRLARFNIKTTEGEPSNSFIGLPIPAAAGILASFALSYQLFVSDNVTVKTIPLIMERMPFFFRLMPALMVLVSFLMVSNVPYMAAKKFKFDRPKPLSLLIVIIAAIFIIIAFPQNIIFILFLAYVLSGLTGYLWRYRHMRRSLLDEARRRREEHGGSGTGGRR